MNPQLNIKTFEIPVGPNTEDKFNDAFWSSLDGVCNALDNIKAREYTDSKCVFFGKPLLESGTLGTKANSEIVVPHKTKSYAEHEGGDDEESIPLCTLRNFPNLIEHCIEWARAQFTDLFESPPASFNKFIKNPNEFFEDIKKQKEAEALDVLENVSKLATNILKGEFKNQLIANNFCPGWKPDKTFMQRVQNEVKNLENKQETPQETQLEDDEEKLNSLLKYLKEYDLQKVFALEKANFEKDDNTNFHIDFITSCANMRAWNYHIQTATQHKCKMIAGKIIPAVATTTAMITGIVEMELFKLLLELPIEKFCNSNINLAISDFKLFEPIGPKRAKEGYDPLENETAYPVPPGWTIWDKVVVDKGDITVQQFVDMFPHIHHGCKVVSLFFKRGNQIGGSPIWLDFPLEKQKEMIEANTHKKISDIYLQSYGYFPPERNYIMLDGSFQTEDDKVASVPPIKFVFKTIK